MLGQLPLGVGEAPPPREAWSAGAAADGARCRVVGVPTVLRRSRLLLTSNDDSGRRLVARVDDRARDRDRRDRRLRVEHIGWDRGVARYRLQHRLRRAARSAAPTRRGSGGRSSSTSSWSPAAGRTPLTSLARHSLPGRYSRTGLRAGGGRRGPVLQRQRRQRRLHERTPDPRRIRAALHLADADELGDVDHRRVRVGVADPHGGRQLRRRTDEPRVGVVLSACPSCRRRGTGTWRATGAPCPCVSTPFKRRHLGQRHARVEHLHTGIVVGVQPGAVGACRCSRRSTGRGADPGWRSSACPTPCRAAPSRWRRWRRTRTAGSAPGPSDRSTGTASCAMRYVVSTTRCSPTICDRRANAQLIDAHVCSCSGDDAATRRIVMRNGFVGSFGVGQRARRRAVDHVGRLHAGLERRRRG